MTAAYHPSSAVSKVCREINIISDESRTKIISAIPYRGKIRRGKFSSFT